MAPDFDLRVETPQKLNLPCEGVNAAAIASAEAVSFTDIKLTPECPSRCC